MSFVRLLTGLFLSLFIFSQAEATTNYNLFTKYPNKYFIETGSYLGDSIELAIDAGFERIHSIEIAQHYYQHCKNRFNAFTFVKIWSGDSANVMEKVLKQVDAPATFWLDGHYVWGISSGKGETNSPILAELEAIRKHSIKTHTILINDIRLLGTEHFDFVTLGQVIQKILEINPNYRISFENGHIPNDVLVAFIIP